MIFSARKFFFLSPDDVYNTKSNVRGNVEQDIDEGDQNSDSESYEEDFGTETSGSEIQLAANQLLVTLSYSLMSQLRQMARMEGVTPGDIVIELLSEGVTRRAFEDASRPTPSHLMTRTGYVPPDVNGNVAQPSMSHHGYNQQNNNNNQRRGQQNNNNQRRNQNGNFNNNKNYSNNNGGGGNNNGGGFSRFGKNRQQNNGPRPQYNNNSQQQNFNSNSNQGGNQNAPAAPAEHHDDGAPKGDRDQKR